MLRSPKIIDDIHQRYGWAELLVFTALTALSVYKGQISVFYVVYLFWWNELINIVMDFIYSKTRQFREPEIQATSLSGIFLLFIYFIFIVVFFGFMANWDNHDLLFVNLRILFFKNLYFNLNLLYLAIIRIFLLMNRKIEPKPGDMFTSNMVVLHISIILGGFIMFLVVKKYPQVFTPENLWGSVLIITPFLLLRLGVQLLGQKKPVP